MPITGSIIYQSEIMTSAPLLEFCLTFPRCTCSGSSKIKEGYPRLHNYIDFRSKQSIFLERAVPKDVSGANFRCKPGHEEYQDYQISQAHSTTGYLCKGTIALYQKNGGGSTFYFDLEDGDDTVLLDSDSNDGNTFIVNNGHKTFTGGAGKDEFILHPNCSTLTGSLDGGGGSNVLMISNEFLPGATVFYNGQDLYSGHVALSVRRITEIVGRSQETEDIKAGCSLKNLRLQGGTRYAPDVITVRGPCHSETKLSAVLEGNTKVTWSDRHFQLVSLPGGSGEKLDIDLKLGTAFDTILINHSPGVMSNFGHSLGSSKLELNWGTSNSGYQYHLKFDYSSIQDMEKVKFLYAEGGGSYSSLLFGKEGLSFIHVLSKIEGVGVSERHAIPEIDNVFILNSGAWDVSCGRGSQQIQLIIGSAFVQGSISCEFSSKNVLTFHENNNQPMELDLSGSDRNGLNFPG